MVQVFQRKPALARKLVDQDLGLFDKLYAVFVPGSKTNSAFNPAKYFANKQRPTELVFAFYNSL